MKFSVETDAKSLREYQRENGDGALIAALDFDDLADNRVRVAVLMAVADAYNALGRLECAIKRWRKALEQQPSYPSAISNIARSLFSLGKTQDAVAFLDEKFAEIDWSFKRYDRNEVCNLLLVYGMLLLRVPRPPGLHQAFLALREFFADDEQAQALVKLGHATEHPTPHDSHQVIKAAVSSYASSAGSDRRLIITRPGNVEMRACLAERYTHALGNNAGIYLAPDDPNSGDHPFDEWKDLYVGAMLQSDLVMTVGLIENFSVAWLDLLGIQEKSVNYPGSYLFWCEVLECLLQKKRVLIVSAFAETMRTQARYLEQIHEGAFNFNITNISFCTAPQSIAFSSASSWYQNFADMKREISTMPFDIALIAAGGYGHPLVSALAESGKSAIYVGGILQMVFGIDGDRYKNDSRIKKNNYWRTPSAEETPARHKDVENGCYW